MKDYFGNYKLRTYLSDGSEMPLRILMYHGITDTDGNGSKHRLDITSSACLNEIKFHIRQGYQVTSSRSIGQKIREVPEFMVTFDDGHLNSFHLIKNLVNEINIPVVLAICPRVVEFNEVYWFEELKARLMLTRIPNITIAGRIFNIEHKEKAFNEIMSYYFSNNILSDKLMEELRLATGDVAEKEVLKSEFIHENMNWTHLLELLESKNVTFAAHTMSHDAATNMNADLFASDAENCKQSIEKKLGVECLDYIYPFGAIDKNSNPKEQVLQELGYINTYTVNPQFNLDGRISLLDRFTGNGLDDSKRYFEYKWNYEHRMLSV